MFTSGSVWAPVCPCHRITLRARWKPLQVVLYESLRISSGGAAAPEFDEKCVHGAQIRARMSNFDVFRDFVRIVTQERPWTPNNFLHNA